VAKPSKKKIQNNDSELVRNFYLTTKNFPDIYQNLLGISKFQSIVHHYYCKYLLGIDYRM